MRTDALTGPPAEPTRRIRYGRAEPTVRQVYALAAALCERLEEEFPQTRLEASETIERLRLENGHPAPRLEDLPPLPRLPPRRARRRQPYPWWQHVRPPRDAEHDDA
jgi:hypothetical protein